MTDERARLARWKRPGGLDGRLAALLSQAERTLEATYDAYYDRLAQILPPDDYERLLAAWAAELDAPPDIAPLFADDEEAERLRRLFWDVERALFLAMCGRVPSEHYWYHELGRVKPPRSWDV